MKMTTSQMTMHHIMHHLITMWHRYSVTLWLFLYSQFWHLEMMAVLCGNCSENQNSKCWILIWESKTMNWCKINQRYLQIWNIFWCYNLSEISEGLSQQGIYKFLLKYQLQSKIYWQTEIDTLSMHRMESKTLREDQNWVRYGQVSKWLMVSKGVVNDCIRMYLVLFPNKKQVSFPPSFVLWTSLSLSPSPPLLFSFQHAIVLLTVLPPCLPLFTYCTPKTFDNRPMVSCDHGKVGWLTTALCRTWDTNNTTVGPLLNPL